MATKVWKGHLNFGLVSIPVYLNTGARDEHVALNQIHAECDSRTSKPDFCKLCNRIISREEIIKVYDKGNEQYVPITKEELEGIAPASEKVMEISECVRWEDVSTIYLAESYYMLPEAAGKQAYAMLVKALRETGRVAIAQLTKTTASTSCSCGPPITD